MFKDIKDYLTNIKDLAGEGNTMQGVVIVVIGAILFFAPVFAMHHYASKTKQYAVQNQQIISETNKLKKKTKEKVKYAKVQKLNQAQTQQKIEKQMKTFVDLQETLLQYQEGKLKDETKKDNANMAMEKFLDKSDLLGADTDGLKLIVPLQFKHVEDLTFRTSYSPQYSVYQKHIFITFNILYKNKYPIFVVNGQYNLNEGKFEKFDTYSTKWTTEYLREPKLVVAEDEWAKHHKNGKMPDKKKKQVIKKAKDDKKRKKNDKKKPVKKDNNKKKRSKKK